MRKQLAKVAEHEGRTMGAVIVTALAKYFESEDAPPESKGYRRPAAIDSDLADQMAKYLADRMAKYLADQMAKQHRELVELIKEKVT
jgi:hypothetical protein